MIRPMLLPAIALLAVLSTAGSARAFNGYENFPFFTGFYQPYGIQYSTTVRTPPYFAVNPPVYYGARHARPYGISPFASLPQVEASDDYRSHRRAEFVAPPALPICNPFCESVDAEPEAIEVMVTEEPLAAGPMRTNPFASAKIAAHSRRLQ